MGNPVTQSRREGVAVICAKPTTYDMWAEELQQGSASPCSKTASCLRRLALTCLLEPKARLNGAGHVRPARALWSAPESFPRTGKAQSVASPGMGLSPSGLQAESLLKRFIKGLTRLPLFVTIRPFSACSTCHALVFSQPWFPGGRQVCGFALLVFWR